MNADRKGIT
jgi:beta-galactosidase